ncbi:Clp protease N-terminal domain-containing protein [Novosphingobium beihaiensis]|uniref:ClpA/ClpB-like protein n=1 Tax=Novosphingobium beihaiensis TaxID=2930389 RepID=A0ABT0BK88_9SPHN|nr:Clp protease N-terminal domain-containing protein [Novosphingobium beihaiensis]MCJ2185370.1 hypothetical protein [Novosphingobium beihaiensis]
MTMLKKLRDRVESIRGIAGLCTRAETIARSGGELEPAAEHFLLAALEMEDGSAARTLAALGHDRASLDHAIREQHAAMLLAAGIPQDHLVEGEAVAAPSGTGLYRATASGQQLLQILSLQARERRSGGFQSVHVLEAAAALRHGIVPRVLRKLGISDQLAQPSQVVG